MDGWVDDDVYIFWLVSVDLGCYGLCLFFVVFGQVLFYVVIVIFGFGMVLE